MTAYEFLMQYKWAEAKRKRLTYNLEKAEANIGGGGINYDGMPKGSDIVSRTENDAIKLTELKEEIAEQILRCERIRMEVQLFIEKLPNEDEKNVLTAIYVQAHPHDPRSVDHPTKMRYVTKMVRYSERHCERLHANGLSSIDRLLQDCPETTTTNTTEKCP